MVEDKKQDLVINGFNTLDLVNPLKNTKNINMFKAEPTQTFFEEQLTDEMCKKINELAPKHLKFSDSL